MENFHTKARWLTRTAVLVALLITLQWATAGTQVFAGQYITGSLVNCVLAIAALFGGISCGIVVAVLSPFFAFMLGIGPKLFPIIPCIALGNVVFVVVLRLISKRRILGVICSAFAKFLTLYLAVVQVFIPLFGNNLKAAQVQMFTAMFSWPQLVTALIGESLAILLIPVLNKAIKKPES